MSAWQIRFHENAVEDLRGLGEREARDVIAAMTERLTRTTSPHETGELLVSEKYGNFWRYRLPACNVLCDLDRAQRMVTVLHVSTG
jgi:mRNA-degrading endonuclease RelE of RelBE toxin-antitoxin system